MGCRRRSPRRHRRRLLERTTVADGRDRWIFRRLRFVGIDATGPSRRLLPVHTQPRRPELPRPGADPKRALRIQDHRHRPELGCLPGGPPGVPGFAVTVELHWPATLSFPTAGVVGLGPVHPRPRRTELPRPDVLGYRSARLGRRVELAAVAVGDGRLQVAETVCRRPGRVTGVCTPGPSQCRGVDDLRRLRAWSDRLLEGASVDDAPGKRTSTSSPPSGDATAVTVPSCASMTAFTMDRPRP